MQRAPIYGGIGVMCLALAGGIAAAQNGRSVSVAEHRLGAERSGFSVRIARSRLAADSTSMDVGADHWIARGFDVKTLIAQIYDVDVRRVDVGDSRLSDSRYDLSLTLPREVDEDVMRRMLKDALDQKFGVTITPESRSQDVYVLTAPNGPGAALHPHRKSGMTLVAQDSAEPASDDAQQITFLGKDCEGVSSGGITASAGTLGEFRRTLEPDLDLLLVDETGLAGSYDFSIGKYRNQQELFQLLRDQLGIVVTPERRDVTVLTVRPRQELRAAM